MNKFISNFIVVAILLSLAACTDPLIDPDSSTAFHQEWPMPMNRTGYLVTGISYYENENNHIEAVFNYDESNRLVSRVIHDTFEDYYGVEHSIMIDSFYYQGERLYKITTETDPSTTACQYDKLFYYDNEGRLIKTSYNNNEICYAYHNGVMDSIYVPNAPMRYTILYYDERGNIIRTRSPEPISDGWGEPTGEYEMRTTEYGYDHNPRPNFNLDNAFVFEPIFGMGTTYPIYVRNLSKNNMIYHTDSGTASEIWEYEYNSLGLPETMRYQFGHLSSGNEPAYHFTYRRAE